MSDSDYAVSLSNVTTSASINTVHAKIKGTTTGGADLKTPTQLTIKTAGSSSSVDMSLVSVAIIDKNSSSGGGSGDSVRVKALEARLDKLEKIINKKTTKKKK
jgi:hypothetical protein